MKAKNITNEEMEKALKQVNKEYKGNIVWKRSPEKSGNFLNFTLTVADSNKPGSRRSAEGRRIAAACWHAHGYLFEAMIKIAPNVIIKSMDKTITAEGGNWQDMNIGSNYNPLYASEACNCE
jgi:hypothetical protein